MNYLQSKESSNEKEFPNCINTFKLHLNIHLGFYSFYYYCFSPKEPSVIYLASPEIVKFTDYKVGQVYELALELKNVTSVLRPIRIVPPRSQYFSVGLGR